MFTSKALYGGLFILVSLPMLDACDQTKRYTDQEYVQRAKEFQAQGKLESAVIELKNALQKNPKNSEARLRLGEIYTDLGLGEQAELELNRAKELGIDNDVLKVPKGQALLLQGLYKRVVSEIQPGPKSPPGDIPKILEIQGRAQLGLLHFEEGCKRFAESVEKDPQYVPSYWGLARCAAARGKLDEARAQLNQALQLEEKNNGTWALIGNLERTAKRLPEAEAAYASALKYKSNDLDALLGRALTRIDEEKLDEASQDVDAAFRVAPDHPVATHVRGVIQFKRGKLGDAKNSFETVLKAVPGNPSALFWLGLTNLSLNNYEQAAKQFSQFLQTAPNAVDVQALLALAQARQGRKKEAAEVLELSRKLNVADPQSLAVLGQARMAIGDVDLATAYLKKAVAEKPQAANFRVGLAASLLEYGDRPQAIAQLEKAVELDPGMITADLLLIRSYLENKQFDKALTEIAALEKKEPKNPTVLNLKGAAYVGKGDYASARAAFEQAFALEPPSVGAAMNLAQLDLKEKNPEAARKRFEAVLAKDGTNVKAMIGLAAVAAAIGDEAGYVAWLEKAVKAAPSVAGPRVALANYHLRKGNIQKSLELALGAQTASPDNPQALDLLAGVQLAAGDAASAAATYRKLVTLMPENPVVHYRLAMAQAAAKDPEAAKASLHKALELAPTFFDAEVLLATIDLRTGQYDDALKLAREIKKQRPQSAIGLTLEGDILMAQKQFAAAARTYDKALGVEKNGLLMIKLHQALSAGGDSKEADKRLLQWLQDQPKDIAARSYLAARYFKAGQNGPAIEQFQLVLQDDPKNILALNQLALVYQKEKDPRALPTAEQAYQLQPNNADITDTLGWILLEQGKTDRALELLQKASAQAPASTEIRYHWAVALSKSGDKAKARTELADLLTKDKNFSQRADAQALLKQLQP